MSKSYWVKGFEVVRTERLHAHPDALMPMDDQDKTCMSTSIADRGVIQPLLVMEKIRKGEPCLFLVVDGCNRLEMAKAAGISELPCIIIETDDVKAVVMECLGTGRKRSTGQRVMAFLELHRRKVLEVAKIVGDGTHRGRKSAVGGSREPPKIPKELEGFTSERIAKRLGISKQDVGMGIDLLRAAEAATEADAPKFEDVRNKLLGGSMPIRRWRPAMAGKWVAQKGRQDVDYGTVMMRGIDNVKTGILNWKKIDADDRALFERRWHEEILPNLPEQLR